MTDAVDLNMQFNKINNKKEKGRTWSRSIPKYCKRGEVCPAGVGTCWNLWIVWGVLKIPFGAFAATCVIENVN